MWCVAAAATEEKRETARSSAGCLQSCVIIIVSCRLIQRTYVEAVQEVKYNFNRVWRNIVVVAFLVDFSLEFLHKLPPPLGWPPPRTPHCWMCLLASFISSLQIHIPCLKEQSKVRGNRLSRTGNLHDYVSKQYCIMYIVNYGSIRFFRCPFFSASSVVTNVSFQKS